MSTVAPVPDLHPWIGNVRAIVTTPWGGTKYVPRVIQRIESYYVDTAIDTDADTWTMDIGDPYGEFTDLLKRDNEIRVQLFTVGQNSDYVLTGIADEADYDEQGTLTLTGRDLTSLAIDSTMRPAQFKHVRAWAIVEEQARYLGFQKTALAHGQMIRKLIQTDGSEQYWDFWYRLYRREQMYIWVEPDGTLKGNTLNYGASPIYFFGTPPNGTAAGIKARYIPVETVAWRKSTQSRVYEVWVFGHKGDNGFMVQTTDPSMGSWIKKPRHILLDTEAHTDATAMKTANEEIFEGKVGSVEVTITIPDPGFLVRQNNIARIDIPEMGLSGEFFVVGARLQGGSQGLLQEIRLREKQYAITRRIPPDPQITTTSSPTTKGGVSSVASQIQRWGTYFIAAANAFHGPWDYDLFLATLLGICDQETSFQNERENGGPGGDHIEWYPYTPQLSIPKTDVIGGVSIPATSTESRTQYEQKFANEPGQYVSRQFGVGPMQLTSQGLKWQADDRMKPNYRDQYAGGRWHPEHNIWVAASYLRSCLKDTVKDSGRDIDMWMGVSAYNKGAGGAYVGDPYAVSVKNKVYNDPGYLNMIKSARQDAAAQAKTSGGTVKSDGPGPLGNYDYKGHIIGTPYQGTHGKAFNQANGTDNWQSENAYDISVPFGHPVYATHDGIIGNWGVLPASGRAVTYSKDEMAKLDRLGGNRVNINGANFDTYYTHMSRINVDVVSDGAHVREGDLIGWSGMANRVEHLHFAASYGKNPADLLPGV